MGGVIRLKSPLNPQYLSQLAGMTLFHPASMIVIWLGWKTGLRVVDLLSAAIVAILSFGVWNAIMLPGLRSDLLERTLVSNAIHWGLFLIVGVASARYVQWGATIGIWAEKKKARGVTQMAPARLSLRKLFLLTAIAAVFAVAYKSLVLQPSRVSVRTTWISFFPLQTKPIISAILGGALVPIHWLVIFAILKSQSFRLAGLILLIPCLMFLRWFIGAIYWDSPLAFPGSDTLDFGAVLELDTRRYASYELAFSQPYPAPVQLSVGWSVYAVEAVAQLSFILLAIQWFRLVGYRVTYWRPISKDYPPAPL